MKRALKYCIAFLASIGLVACLATTVGEIEGVKQQDIEKSEDSKAPPSFADMVNINTPLGYVEGSNASLPYPVRINEELAKKLNNFSEGRNDYSLIVWHKGKIIYENYPGPYSLNTRAESASMHKSVLALAVGAAIDGGYIEGVDAEVGQYIPQWADDARGKITVKDFLEMSSGLSPLSVEGGEDSDAARFWRGGSSARQLLLGMKLKEELRSVFHYKNSDSQALGLIIENATGEAYDSFLSRTIWKRIGAKNAKVWYNEETGFPKTYSSLYATPRDWLRVGLLVKDMGRFAGNQIIAKSFITEMTSESRANENYGWQIWLGTKYSPKRYYNAAKVGLSVNAAEPFAVKDLMFFDGFGGQRVYISRSEDLVIIRTGDVDMSWDDSVLPNLVINHLNVSESAMK